MQLFNKETVLRNVQNEPFRIISVDWSGNFTTFSPELLGLKEPRFGDFSLGNFITDGFEQAEASQKFQILNAEIQRGVALCRATLLFLVCGGGAPVNKLYETGTFASAETMYCRLHKQALMDVLLEKIEQSSNGAANYSLESNADYL